MTSGETPELSRLVDELLTWLPRAEELLAEHDTEPGAGGGGKPSSSPPWNTQVAWAVLDVHEGARRLEAALKLALTGSPGRRRGGSNAGTEKALRQVAVLGSQLGLDPAKVAAKIVERWLTSLQQLPAIDEAPVWRKLGQGSDGLPPRCPYCETYQLRVAVRSRVVTCWFPNCEDRNGVRPVGTMDRLLAGPQAGQPVLIWADGLMQIPPGEVA